MGQNANFPFTLLFSNCYILAPKTFLNFLCNIPYYQLLKVKPVHLTSSSYVDICPLAVHISLSPFSLSSLSLPFHCHLISFLLYPLLPLFFHPSVYFTLLSSHSFFLSLFSFHSFFLSLLFPLTLFPFTPFSSHSFPFTPFSSHSFSSHTFLLSFFFPLTRITLCYIIMLRL